ncbi:MAG: 3-oxoacyl-acyl-carrier-protein synthase I [Puniceicoccaceae bacterium 5H]|nr:MAG: 3-oxoacyl-acyl-carrier-protein synthase I [Puniceicoccaceae bacterium 5H]
MALPPVYVHQGAALTAWGDAPTSVRHLLAGEVALKLQPVFGSEGGDHVPLAVRGGTIDATLPARWWDDLMAFAQPYAGSDWGTARRPIILTSSNYSVDQLYGYTRARSDATAAKDWQDVLPHRIAGRLQSALGWGPRVSILSHACVTAQVGISQAMQWLRHDLADAVLVFSFDYLSAFVAGGFHSLKILNAHLPQPYVEREEGSIGLGDGVAALVLKREPSPWKLTGASLYNEMHHFTANREDGVGFQRVLEPLLPLIAPEAVWVKGHGTGTRQAGQLEVSALNQLLPHAPLVGWKGSLGHTLGSCGAVELVLAIAAIEAGRIPGTVGSHGQTIGPQVKLDPFAADAYRQALILSNAFGGAHAAHLLEYAA